jgi:hypothetical protein
MLLVKQMNTRTFIYLIIHGQFNTDIMINPRKLCVLMAKQPVRQAILCEEICGDVFANLFDDVKLTK